MSEATQHHHHGIGSTAAAGARSLLIVLALILAFVVIEVIGAVATGSLALLADAGHMLADAVGIGLALLAVWFARRPATTAKSYGYYRVEIFAAALNGVALLGISAFIFIEAIRRLGSPVEVRPIPMFAVAAVGVVVAGASVRLLHRGAQRSLNLRAAYLEMLGDLLGLGAVILAGLVILLTGWTPIDPLASVAIGILILPRVWNLLRDAVDVLLQATPAGVDLDEVRRHVLGAPGVAGIHDLHAWTLTSGINVVSVHVVLHDSADQNQVLDELCDCLADDFDMEHSTIQLEQVDRSPVERATHP